MSAHRHTFWSGSCPRYSEALEWCSPPLNHPELKQEVSKFITKHQNSPHLFKPGSILTFAGKLKNGEEIEIKLRIKETHDGPIPSYLLFDIIHEDPDQVLQNWNKFFAKYPKILPPKAHPMRLFRMRWRPRALVMMMTFVHFDKLPTLYIAAAQQCELKLKWRNAMKIEFMNNGNKKQIKSWIKSIGAKFNQKKYKSKYRNINNVVVMLSSWGKANKYIYSSSKEKISIAKIERKVVRAIPNKQVDIIRNIYSVECALAECSETDNLKLCRCGKMAYCGRRHQKLHWKEIHNKKCAERILFK